NEEPDVKENEEPDVKENEEPDVKENEEPDVKEIEEPDVKEIEEPDVKENEEPDVKKNEEPDVKEDKRHTFEENELNVKQDTGVSAKEVKDTDTKQVQEVIPKQGQGQGFGQVRTQHVALEEDPNQVEIKVMQNETDTNKDSMLQGTLQQHCHSQFAKIVEGKQEDKCNGKPIVEIDSKQSDKYAHKKAPHKHDNKQDEHFNAEQENKQQHQPKELVGVDHMPDHNQFTDHKNSEAKSTSIDIQQQNQGGHQFNKQVNSIQQVQKSGDHQDDGRESIGHWNDNQFNYMYLPSSMSSEQRGEDEEINWQQTSMQGAEQHSSSFLPHSENGKINSNGKAQHQRCIYNPNKYQHHINQKQVSQQDYSSNLTENIPEQIGHPVGKGDELQEKVLREYQGVVQNTQRDHHQQSSKHDNCESVNQGEMHFSQQNYKHHENQQGYLQQCDQAYPDSPNHHQPHHKDCTNAYYSPPPEYGRGSYGRRPRRGRGKSEYYQQQQHHQQQHHHRNQNSQGFSQSRLLTCGCCNEKYDLDFKHPRVLYCHHTFCTECIAYMYHMGTVYCYTCNKRTWRVTAPNNLPINQTLFGLMKEGICKPTVTVGESDQPVNQSYITKEDPIRGEQLCKPPKQRGKSIKTAQSDQVDSRRENLASSSSELPHDGRCVEYGIRIIAHCTTCQQWVCESCQKVDHNKKGCVLRPIKIALAEMKQNSVKKAHSTCDFLSKSVKDLQIYSDHLNVLLLSMRAAFQCFEKEYDSTKKALQEGTQNEKHLKDVELKLSSLTNLPNAIAGLQGLDNECDVAQRWMSSTLSRTISTGAVKGAAKDLLSITLQTLRTSTTDNGQVKQLVACQEKSSGKKFSHLTVNGGRIFLHCLTGTLTLKEARQLPLECFKSYLDGAASLTFFDLSWDGACQGQVYIRLTGDTVRGRQFLDLCTGEKGVSFQKTPFHRIWWKGHPGEHIWGGDYEQGDGSGGASVSNNSDIDKAGILGRAVPITAGLVAGRYEKKNVSSIFRIYTREAKGVIEEAAFGQVEFGLDVIQRAINQKNIKDVIISDCGVVLE
ncbi:Peptidyl-prolyl cis-trans isomerase B-like 2, partial [Homarus americanus]